MEEQIKNACEVLRNGGLILYPTDTIWGIGCDATNPEAVKRVYQLKRRDDSKSMIVLIEHPADAALWVENVPEIADQLWEVTDKPLTLILDGGTGLAGNLLPPEKTVALRPVRNDFCQKLLRRFKKPIVSTSANVSGESAPARFGDIPDAIRDGVDFVVDPACEGDTTGTASSIIRLSGDGQFTILRP